MFRSNVSRMSYITDHEPRSHDGPATACMITGAVLW